MYTHAYAATVASELVETMSEYCERIEIVGSLRRLKSTVNDIDIIAIPKFVKSKDDTLFGEPVKVNLLDQKLSELCLERSLTLEANGEKIKRFIMQIENSSIPIDIYIASEATWWTLLLIRTGSREHNIKLATRALELHMQLKADGNGLMSPGGKLIQIQSEQEIFLHLGLPYRKPAERD